MPEVVSTLKSLLVALIIIVCLQVKIGSATLENHAQEWIHTSSVGLYLQGAADGAALMFHQAGKSVSNFVGKTFGYRSHSVETQRAGRLNFSFKRSPAYEQSRNQKENE